MLLLLPLISAKPAVEVRAPIVFVCNGGHSFTVTLQGRTAEVSIRNRAYRLVSKPSSLGARYASGKATLIIEREYAAFDAEDLNDLRGCNSGGRLN